jgi:hypothetical protein
MQSTPIPHAHETTTLFEHNTEIEAGHATAGHDSVENGEPSSLPPS